ncbi:MAG TPA: oligosaccharide flippase family protein [Bacteroidales bacterium]|nr:oligosaccharide flippase family protein [Bacteroidales bacterium]
MNSIRRLAGQTAIYGIPTILGRFLQYLLVILLTRVFSESEYGTISVFYAYASFLMVVLTYGMETAFFRFSESEENKDRVFSTALLSLILTSASFILLTNIFSGGLAAWIKYPGHPEYVIWFAWILGLDAISAIPFARLRAQNKPARFATIKMINILTNVLLTLFFLLLCPFVLKHSPDSAFAGFVKLIYKPGWGIAYVFLANLAASILTLILLLPQISGMRWELHPVLWRKMLTYAWPLLFAGLAGIVNETFDRLLLRYLLPLSPNLSEMQVGIYSACYKISILLTLFVQAYRFAAEPFFFAKSKDQDARVVYARIMDYFIITVSLIFLVTMLYLDDIFIHLIGYKFREGKKVIPILMLANLFLGVYYNLSIWYKLTSRTLWGAWLSAIGAVITLILNFWWIPLSPDHLIYGYLGSAWATFICYGSMMVLSYLLGQKYYPIRYNLLKLGGYLGFAILLWILSTLPGFHSALPRLLFNTFLLLVFAVTAFLVEKPRLSKAL